MDTSKEYIEMRIGAIPFMGKGDSPSLPITLFTYYDPYSVLVDAFGNFFIQDNTRPYICILERQDQLQDMLIEPLCKTFVYWMERFYIWADNRERHESMIGGCYSMEQLWLAFVINELYQKKWNGKEWAESLPHPTKSAPVVDENEGK